MGDIVVLKLRGDAIYRSLIFGIESTDGKHHIQFPASAFRLLATGDNLKPESFDQKMIEEKSSATVSKSDGDGTMISLWNNHRIKQCQFIQPPEKGQWAIFGTIISEEMLAER